MKRWLYRQIFENTKISHFMKIRPVRAELFVADGRTHAISQFCEKRHTRICLVKNIQHPMTS